MRSDNISHSDARLLMKNIAAIDADRSKGGHASVTAMIIQGNKRVHGLNLLGSNNTKMYLNTHAEATAISNLVLEPYLDAKKSTLITTRFPCEYCAVQIIKHGIACVISPPIREDSKWAESQMIAKRILCYAGVSVREIIVEGVRG